MKNIPRLEYTMRVRVAYSVPCGDVWLVPCCGDSFLFNLAIVSHDFLRSLACATWPALARPSPRYPRDAEPHAMLFVSITVAILSS